MNARSTENPVNLPVRDMRVVYAAGVEISISSLRDEREQLSKRISAIDKVLSGLHELGIEDAPVVSAATSMVKVIERWGLDPERERQRQRRTKLAAERFKKRALNIACEGPLISKDAIQERLVEEKIAEPGRRDSEFILRVLNDAVGAGELMKINGLFGPNRYPSETGVPTPGQLTGE
jgi:hypothetical protein